MSGGEELLLSHMARYPLAMSHGFDRQLGFCISKLNNVLQLSSHKACLTCLFSFIWVINVIRNMSGRHNDERKFESTTSFYLLPILDLDISCIDFPSMPSSNYRSRTLTESMNVHVIF